MVRRQAPLLTSLLALGIAGALLLAPLLPPPHTLGWFRLAAYASTATYFALVALLLATLPPLQRRGGRRIAVYAAVAFAAVVATNLLALPVASDVAKVAFGGLAGIGLVLAIERPWWLAPVCVCVPAADAWSVFSSRGVTHAVVERARDEPAWIDWPTVATPIAGFDYADFGRVGIVDLLFVALFLGAAHRWGLGLRRNIVAVVAAFVATNVLVYELLLSAVPALPLLCLAFLAVNAPTLWHDLRADLAARD